MRTATLITICAVLAATLAGCADGTPDGGDSTPFPIASPIDAAGGRSAASRDLAFDVDRNVPPELQQPMNSDGTAGSGCTPGGGKLADGVWYGNVEDWAGGVAVFDLMCVYHPESERAGGDLAASPGAEPIGGYTTTNKNPQTRDLPVHPEAQFFPPDYLWYPNQPPGTFEDIVSVWGTGEYWIYVNDGHITAAIAAYTP